MQMLAQLRNIMSDREDATPADCLHWSKAEWKDYPDHGGMVRVSIPISGRSAFREQALKDGWEEYSHFTSMLALPAILECGILLPSEMKNGEELLHCCDWADGPSARPIHHTCKIRRGPQGQ